MKRTITTAAVVLAALTGAASAMIPDSQRDLIQSYAPEADVSTLSDQEVASILSVIHSGDSEGEKRSYVRSVTK